MSKVNINDILKEYFNEAGEGEKPAGTTPQPNGGSEPDAGAKPSAGANTNNTLDAQTYQAIIKNYQLYCRTYIQSIRTISDYIYYDYKKIIDTLNDNLAQQGKPAPQQQNQQQQQGEQQNQGGNNQGQGNQESSAEFDLDEYAGEMSAFDEMLADESVIGDVKNTAKDWLNSGESLVKYSKRKIKNKIDNALSDDDDKKKKDEPSVADKTKAIFRKHGVDV